MRVANNDDINKMFIALLRHKSNIDRGVVIPFFFNKWYQYKKTQHNRKCTQLAALPCYAAAVVFYLPFLK